MQEIINSVKETLIKSNPDCDIVIKRLHLYYDIKLVTFGIDVKRNLIIVSVICTALYATAPYFISIRDSSSSYNKSEY